MLPLVDRLNVLTMVRHGARKTPFIAAIDWHGDERQQGVRDASHPDPSTPSEVNDRHVLPAPGS